MIQPNELRIGNYINDEQTTHIVVGVDNYYIKSYWLKDTNKETLYETPINQIKPIPLTEELLFKCGFAPNNGKMILGEFKIEIFMDGSGHVFDWNGFVITVKFKYLHQLQNIFFALTNKELKINL